MPEEFSSRSAEQDAGATGPVPDQTTSGESPEALQASAPEPPAAPGPEFRAALEAIIYAAEEPVTVAQLASAAHGDKDAVRRALRELMAVYAGEDRGIEIREVAG